jgi:outer membrane immunogenic protein
MKRVGIFIAAALPFGLSQVALSADMPQKAPAPVYKTVAPNDPWAGFYVGVEGGEGWASTHVENLASSTGTLKDRGSFFGGTVGYNWQWSNLVLGIEGDYSSANISAIGHDAAVAPTCTAGGLGECGAKLSSLGTVRARLGYAFDRTLVYATIGEGFGELKGMQSNGAGSFSGTKTSSGLVYGGGLEVLLFPNWSAKIEYLRVDLGDGPTFSTVGLVPLRNIKDWQADIVRVGLNYKFGAP